MRKKIVIGFEKMKHVRLQEIEICRMTVSPYYARTISEEAYQGLKRTIQHFGIVQPIVWNKRTGHVVGGRWKLNILREENEKKARVVVVDLPEGEEKLLSLQLNNRHIQGEWDIDKVEELIKDIKESLEGEDFIEMRIAELEREIDLELKARRGLVDEDEVPEIPEDPDTQEGYVYQLGRHRLMCGDSTDPDLVRQLLDGATGDMVFTDPPYNVDYGNAMRDKIRKGTSRTILNDNFGSSEEFYCFLSDAIAAFKPHVTGDVYICMSSSELHTLWKAFTDNGGKWSTFIIWVKNHFTLTRSNYQRQYEPILYGWFKGSSHYWSGVRNLADIYQDEIKKDKDGTPLIRVEACSIESGVWPFDKPSRSDEHPTMKPVALCRRAIKNSSPPDGVVIDTFGGSGSTLIGCEQTGRTCYVMELDPKFCDVIVERWENFTGENAELIKRGEV